MSVCYLWGKSIHGCRPAALHESLTSLKEVLFFYNLVCQFVRFMQKIPIHQSYWRDVALSFLQTLTWNKWSKVSFFVTTKQILDFCRCSSLWILEISFNREIENVKMFTCTMLNYIIFTSIGKYAWFSLILHEKSSIFYRCKLSINNNAQVIFLCNPAHRQSSWT